MPERKFWRLLSRRAISTVDDKLKPHAPSRHQATDYNLINPRSNNNHDKEFHQGTLFPKHVKAGDITQIEHQVQQEWEAHAKGRKSKVCSEQSAGNAVRISVKLGKFGVRIVGAFIRLGQVATVFPEESSGSTYLLKGSRPIKKSNR